MPSSKVSKKTKSPEPPVRESSSKRQLKHSKTSDSAMIGKKRKLQEMKPEKVRGDKAEKKKKRSPSPPVIESRKTRSTIVVQDLKKKGKK